MDVRLPIRDCFASARNPPTREFWDSTSDAFSFHWGTGDLLWMNPPFSILSQVLGKIIRDHAFAFLVVPRWESAPWWPLVMLSTRRLALPREPLFRVRGGGPLLPCPSWEAWVLLFHPCPRASSWVRDLVSDGDVEANPGPLVSFGEFAASYAGKFIPTIPATDAMRQRIELDVRSRHWPDGWLVTLLNTNSILCPPEEAGDLIMAYEIYGRVRLQWDSSWASWATAGSGDDEVRALRAQLAELELRLKPPTEAHLKETLDSSSIARFKSLPGIPH